MIINFYILYKALGYSSLSLGHFFFIIPIVLVLSAIPISPLGIGVGQLAMYQLFTNLGVRSAAEGVNLITLYQSITMCVNILGVFPYLRTKKMIKNH